MKEGAGPLSRRSLNANPEPSAAAEKARVTSKTMEVVEISDSDESDGTELENGQLLNVRLCAGAPFFASPE